MCIEGRKRRGGRRVEKMRERERVRRAEKNEERESERGSEEGGQRVHIWGVGGREVKGRKRWREREK